MDFAFSEEQKDLRELARKILEEQVTNDRLKDIEAKAPVHDAALWQELAKAPVDFNDAVDRGGATSKPTPINPFLDGNMGLGLELQITLLGVCAVILFEGTLNIDGMRIMPFDEIAVIAIHCPNQLGQRRHDAIRQAAAEAARRLRQLKGQVT